jgi:hypothetical protein
MTFRRTGFHALAGIVALGIVVLAPPNRAFAQLTFVPGDVSSVFMVMATAAARTPTTGHRR